MHKRVNARAIGAFVVGALALAVLAAAILGSGRLFRRTHEYLLFFQGNVNGLRIGAAVKFKGVEIGQVKQILLNLNLGQATTPAVPSSGVRIPVVIEIDQGRLVGRGATRLNLDDPGVMKQMIAMGLRANLSMESFVTGILYVDLDFHPETPANFVLPASYGYEEIPTVPTALEQAQSALNRFLAAIADVDFKTLVATTTETVSTIRQIVRSPELKNSVASLNRTADGLNQTAASIRKVALQLNQQIGPVGSSLRQSAQSADVALKQANATLNDIQATLSGDSPLIYQTDRTLEDVSSAARAVKELADYLHRNPGALVRGRYQSSDNR
jgi:phospholipid/cholesterol/gamma-HCH transport system substrate-binding protein